MLGETFVPSDRYIYEHQIVHTEAPPPFVRADLIQPLDPEVDLTAEPGALWVDAMTNPVWLLGGPHPAAVTDHAALGRPIVKFRTICSLLSVPALLRLA